MVTKAELEALQRAIQPRLPRGSPENMARIGQAARYFAALKRYTKEQEDAEKRT